MESIFYQQNYNNKLDCPVHTTIRLYNPSKFAVGKEFNEYLICKKDTPDSFMLDGKNVIKVATVKCIEVKVYQLKDITSSMAWIDTGKGLAYLKSLLEHIYARELKTNPNPHFHWVLLKNINHQ
ncbi:MAG: hypothetical protein V4538_01565 [Bacteroidota bacterium]